MRGQRLASAGIVLSPGDTPTIASVRPGSEAARQKLRPGDKIEGVNVPNDRPSPFLFAIPALPRSSASSVLQRRRPPSRASLSGTPGRLLRLARGCRPLTPAFKQSWKEERSMNWDRIEGNWKQMTGKVKEKWGKLTDDDITQINGNRDQLEGKLQARYGYAKDQVKKDVDDWLGRM